MRARLDKIASVTARLQLPSQVVLGESVPAAAGAVVAGRVLNTKRRYNQLEDVHGRMVGVQAGDVIAGALGHRDALHGFSGRVPQQVAVGDELQLLNLGGVLGVGAEPSPRTGEPFRVEVLGSVLAFPDGDRLHGEPAFIQSASLSAPAALPVPSSLPPSVTLLGTSMNAGKTTAACTLIAALRREGERVAAGKLTGVSLRRDVLEMADSGASATALFTDFGVVTTDASSAPACARALVAHLAQGEPRPDRLVLEMGDGLLGTYGVRALLEDAYVRASLGRLVLCASDPVGAWGATRLLREDYQLEPALVSGPVTDSAAGRSFVEDKLGLPCWNALRDGDAVRTWLQTTSPLELAQ